MAYNTWEFLQYSIFVSFSITNVNSLGQWMCLISHSKYVKAVTCSITFSCKHFLLWSKCIFPFERLSLQQKYKIYFDHALWNFTTSVSCHVCQVRQINFILTFQEKESQIDTATICINNNNNQQMITDEIMHH